jgi:hypothetical protein
MLVNTQEVTSLEGHDMTSRERGVCDAEHLRPTASVLALHTRKMCGYRLVSKHMLVLVASLLL